MSYKVSVDPIPYGDDRNTLREWLFYSVYNRITGPLDHDGYTLSELTNITELAAANNKRKTIYYEDEGVMAYSNGTNWVRSHDLSVIV